jgi:hypothetical protein
MAREKMKFSCIEAKLLSLYILERANGMTKKHIQFMDKNFIDGFVGNPASLDELRVISKKLDRLSRNGNELSMLSQGAVYNLRDWIEKRITPEGYVRILAAQRKTLTSHGRRTTQILTTFEASKQLLSLAEDYSVPRSEMLSNLTQWLSFTQEGNAAFALFARANNMIKKVSDKTEIQTNNYLE